MVLVGGGLQSALIALAVWSRRPQARLAIVEAEPALGGNHTWCFHGSAVPEAARAWVEPLVVERWPRWEVRFPALRRTFEHAYAAITSARLHRVLSEQAARHAGSALLLGARATELGASSVLLESGRRLDAPLVIDARGPQAPRGPCAWQKFVGVELELREPGPIQTPILMDACVEQLDGFRFIYVLPFAAREGELASGIAPSPPRVLIEETHYADSPLLDESRLHARVLASAERLGFKPGAVVRTERGVLPLPLSWPERPPDDGSGPLLAGYGGGFFHPTTGYSFPLALRVAEQLARAPGRPQIAPAWSAFVADHHRQARFAVLLNRFLFLATPPEHRRDMLEQFHGLPEDAVARFYALQPSGVDRLRILCGRPPRGLSLRRALREAVST